MNRKIYVAAPWAHRPEARDAAAFLVSTGHEVTSHWLNWPEGDHSSPAEQLHEALTDLNDINRADAVILLNDFPPSTGRAIETGYAIAIHKPVVLVGPISSPFHYMPNVKQVSTLREALDVL